MCLCVVVSVVGTAVVRRARRAAAVTRRDTAAPSVSTRIGSDIISSAARGSRRSPNPCPPWAHASWPKPPRAAPSPVPAWRKPPTPPERPHRPHRRPPPPPRTPADTSGKDDCNSRMWQNQDVQTCFLRVYSLLTDRTTCFWLIWCRSSGDWFHPHKLLSVLRERLFVCVRVWMCVSVNIRAI